MAEGADGKSPPAWENEANMRRQILVVALMLALVAMATQREAPGGGGDPVVQMVPPDGDGVKYWPRWRGPSGQGVVADGDYPDQWSDTDNVRWKADVPGGGN